MTWLEKPDELRNGACVGHSRLFFAPHAERPTNRVVRERKALALCAVCTVKAACEAWADRNRETEGIWAGKVRARGGDTPDETIRRTIRRWLGHRAHDHRTGAANCPACQTRRRTCGDPTCPICGEPTP